MNYPISLYNKALKVAYLPLVFKKNKGSWAAFLPEKIDKDGAPIGVSKVALCDWNNSLKRLRFVVASRYLAQVYEDSMVCHVNLRWAMKLPNWSSKFGALHELARAMERAKLI